jgi:hypothetical protein
VVPDQRAALVLLFFERIKGKLVERYGSVAPTLGRPNVPVPIRATDLQLAPSEIDVTPLKGKQLSAS